MHDIKLSIQNNGRHDIDNEDNSCFKTDSKYLYTLKK